MENKVAPSLGSLVSWACLRLESGKLRQGRLALHTDLNAGEGGPHGVSC